MKTKAMRPALTLFPIAETPPEACPACGGTSFWRRFEGGVPLTNWNCDRCHPEPVTREAST